MVFCAGVPDGFKGPAIFGVAVGVAPGFAPAVAAEAIDGFSVFAELVFDEVGPRVADKLVFLFAGKVEFRCPVVGFAAL